MKIPVIDIGSYLAGEKGALEAIGAASESLGVYFLGNHGIPQALIDRVFAEMQRFYELPLATRPARCAIRSRSSSACAPM